MSRAAAAQARHRSPLAWRLFATLLAAFTLGLSGCHHSHPRVAYQPPPPSASRSPHRSPDVSRTPPRPRMPDDLRGPPIYTEVGLASWYGPKFNHHAAADGSLYDKDALTAAHRTLPLGTTARITNLTTGQQVFVRITDRGPFSPGRILDLSEGAAKEVGVYRAGVARVRIEAFAHNSTDPPGQWCVQTGPFTAERDAQDLKRALSGRYQGARVAEFPSSTGFWVRIDPVGHARRDALAIQDWIGDPDPHAKAYLVRID
ncbi:MAG TPA: septal ring lytic transglycosylase RlpA family protein [Acidobacteriaceae bacterium]|nr:septal ring lytic transglycosylase RlpA family protein [Acidobacteriaceae bacterium]